MDYKKEIHKLVETVEQESVLAFLLSFIRSVLNNDDAVSYLSGLRHGSSSSK